MVVDVANRCFLIGYWAKLNVDMNRPNKVCNINYKILTSATYQLALELSWTEQIRPKKQ